MFSSSALEKPQKYIVPRGPTDPLKGAKGRILKTLKKHVKEGTAI